MRCDDLSRKGKPQAGAAFLALARHPEELVEDVGLILRRNANACVGHGENDLVVAGLR